MSFSPNEGRQPPATIGKRVRVVLRNGMRPTESWPADGKGGLRWSITGHAFDVLEWEVA